MVTQIEPTTIYSDSQSAIALSENPIYHSRSKHVDIQYHFTFMPTSHMTSDILTKILPKDKHITCMSQLGMCLISQSQTPQHIQNQFNLQILTLVIYTCQSVKPYILTSL